jgi:hypothetical protein
MASSPRDQRHYEPRSPAALEKEFPEWQVRRGTDRLYHALLIDSDPPVTLLGADLMDLRDEIIKFQRLAEAQQQ